MEDTLKYLPHTPLNRSPKFKVYKAISDSQEYCKITNCIAFSIILNYLIFTIKLWMGFVYARKHQQTIKFVYCIEKYPVVQHFILIMCSNHVQ